MDTAGSSRQVTDHGPPALHIIAGLVEGLGAGGVALVLWTGIMIAALVKSDNATIRHIWCHLFVTWLVIFVGEIIVRASVARARYLKELKDSLVPVTDDIVEPPDGKSTDVSLTSA